MLLVIPIQTVTVHGTSTVPTQSSISNQRIFYWNFNDGTAPGWVPVIGWNSDTGQPQYPISCQIVNGEYSLTTCEPIYRLHNFTDFVYSAQVRVVQAPIQPIWGIGFRINPANSQYASITAVTGDKYTLAQGYFMEFIGSSLYLYMCQATCSVLASASPNINIYANNYLTVLAYGSTIIGFVNGVQSFNVVDSTFSQGTLMLFSIPNGCCNAAIITNFDNVLLATLP
jgi:hypothetical protein